MDDDDDLMGGFSMRSNWIDFYAESNVSEGEVVGVEIAGKNLALFSVGGALFVTEGKCTHGHAHLCDGYLEDFEIECPLHQGRFDIRTGKAMCAPLMEDLKVYPVKIEDGRIFVDLGATCDDMS
jgi:naphthalene 1,2-dioxygenase system ferredoxin subunit